MCLAVGPVSENLSFNIAGGGVHYKNVVGYASVFVVVGDCCRQ